MKDFHDYSVYIKGGVAVVELLILNTFFYVVFSTHPGIMESASSRLPLDERIRIFYAVTNLSYMIALSWGGIVLHQRTVIFEAIIERVTKLEIIHCALTFIVMYVMRIYVSLNFLFGSALILFVLFTLWRISARLILKHYRKSGRNSKRIIVLGAGSVANDLYARLMSNLSYGYKFYGFFDDREEKDYKVKKELVKGKIDDVQRYVAENDIQEIYCALPAGDDRKALPIINFAENNCIRCYIVPDFRRFIHKKVNLSFIADVPIVSLRNEPLLTLSNRIIKRAFDFIVSLIFTCTIFPFLFIILIVTR